jgi:hypothetical protein
MADSCLNFAKQETDRLDREIEVLQGSIRLHNETKNAWDTILRNAGNESQAAYLDLANSQTARLDGEIEAAQEEIGRHTETKVAWDRIMRSAGSESYISRSITYEKGEDGQWHLHRLDMEIEALKENIHLHDETKDAWGTIVCNTVGESKAACLDLANSETARLDGEIDAVQQEISRRLETRNAWDTIMRNAVSESRIFQGAMYMRGWDGKWHLQPAQAGESNDEGDRMRTINVHSKVNSVGQALLNACDRTLRGPQKRRSIPSNGKAQLQSLGLR